MAQRGTVERYQLLVIGGSAGSLEVILQLLPALQLEVSIAIVVVIHRRSGESMLAQLLKGKTFWPVKEAEEKESIEQGTIYVAPADYHLLIENDKTFSLDYSEKINYSRPAIDVTYETAAEAYGDRVIGLLLSGANQDGTNGLKKIKDSGGYVLIQEPGEAQVSYMPQHAIGQVHADAVLPAAEIPTHVHRLLLP